jgi:FixJ family two-component response regulator
MSRPEFTVPAGAAVETSVGISLSLAPVYLVDDDAAVVKATKFLLESHGATVRAYTCPKEFLHAARLIRGPGCVLLDMSMPQMSGVSVQRQLTEIAPHLTVVIMTGLASYASCADAMRCGAIDIVGKPVQADAFVDQVAQYLKVAVQHWERCQGKSDFRRRYQTLTGREVEVFWLLLEGQQTKQLAYQLVISVSTAEKHVRNVLKKFQVNTPVRLILTYTRHGGLVSSDVGSREA